MNRQITIHTWRALLELSGAAAVPSIFFLFFVERSGDWKVTFCEFELSGAFRCPIGDCSSFTSVSAFDVFEGRLSGTLSF